MNSRLRKCFLAIIITFIPIQLHLNNILNKKITEKPVSSNVYKVSHKDLSQLNKELSFLNNCIILNANKDNNIWYIKLKLYGGKDEILDEMKKLENYKIKSYIISKDIAESCVILYIYSNE